MSGQYHAPAALYPRERQGTHCTGGWVDPRTGLVAQTNVQESLVLGPHILRILNAVSFFIPRIFRAKKGDCKNKIS